MASELKQKIVLKTEEYSKKIKEANQQFKAAMKDMSDGLLNNSKAFQQNESQSFKWGKSVGETLKNVGRSFKENLGTGARALALRLGDMGITQAARDATQLGFSFSKAFAEIKAKSNASTNDLEKWKKSLMGIGAETGASMDSLAESFKDLFNVVGDKDELLKVMNQIGMAAGATNGDATLATKQIKENLTSQGKQVNSANVADLLQGAQLAAMKGDFKDINESMAAFNTIGGVNMAKSGLSSRELAGLLSGATAAGGSTEMGVKAVSELLSANANNTMQGSVLSGILGGSISKNGKLDIAGIMGSGAYEKMMNQSGGNENQAREMFKAMATQSGMSDEGAEALFSMIKNVKQFNTTFKSTIDETKSFDQYYKDSADNLKTSYDKMMNSFVKGFTDIFGGAEGPLKDLMNGNIGGAIGGIPGALGQAGRGIADNPMLAAGAVATTAIGGSLITGLLSKIPGIGGIAGGLAKGALAKQAGVDPVYVTNAAEIGEASGGGAGGFMKRMLPLLKGAGLVAGAGVAGYAVGSAINKYGPTFEGTTDEGFQGGLLERLFFKLDKLVGGDASSDFMKNQKIKLEIDTKDPMFSTRPKSTDNPRDSKGY